MLSDQVIARLDVLSLILKDYARGGAGGMRQSKALGSSVEFSDYREYAQGDDIRRVDWNAYARFGRLFLKLFMEELELNMTIVLDASRSMAFGEPTKWKFSVEVAEALAYLALNRGDRVSVAVLTGSEARVSPVYSGRHGYMRLCGYLDAIDAKGETRLNAAIERLRIAGRGLTVVLSDLFSEDGYEAALGSLLYRKQQVELVQVLSREEMEPEYDGAIRLVDSEGGKAVDLLAGQSAIRAYEKALEEFLDGAKGYCRKRGMGYVCLQSDMDLGKDALSALIKGGVIGGVR